MRFSGYPTLLSAFELTWQQRRDAKPGPACRKSIPYLRPGPGGIEARSGAHHWARACLRFGHTVRLMAPKCVTPYRMSGKRGKNDAADAAAIADALTHPNMPSPSRSIANAKLKIEIEIDVLDVTV